MFFDFYLQLTSLREVTVHLVRFGLKVQLARQIFRKNIKNQIS
jgi:hypothetical protein